MRDMQQSSSNSQRGAVSLFVVIFTAILITTITIGFMRLMTRDLQQASNSDLSQSAYDSALAGVEDAKRVLLLREDCGDTDSDTCDDIRDAIASDSCNTTNVALHGVAVGDNSEVAVEQGGDDSQLNQAYTCVKITMDTDSYLGSLTPGSNPAVIPLRAVEDFSAIKVSWHQRKGGDTKVCLPGVDDCASEDLTDGTLPGVGEAEWPASQPALLRAQLINGGDSFRLSDLDTDGHSHSMFLYPSNSVGEVLSFTDNSRVAGATEAGEEDPYLVRCDIAVASGGYACEATISLGATVKSGSRTAFLSLIAFYNATDFEVQLLSSSGGNVVDFDGVQPEVDSTGRANDLFRRVVSRVEMSSTFNYPTSAIETAGDLCKIFTVTDDRDDYGSGGCTP